MSTETFPASTSNESPELVPTTDQLEIIVNGPPSVEVDIPVETRGSRIRRRIADFLNDKFIEPLHTRADQDDAYATYDDNIKYSKDRDQAYKMNSRFDRHEKVRSTLQDIGHIALGIGIVGAAKAINGVESASTLIKDTASAQYESAKDSTLRSLDTVYFTAKDAAGLVADKVNDTTNLAKERIVSTKEFIQEKYVAAQGRKAARINRRHESYEATKGKAVELWNMTQLKRRSLGAKALGLYHSTQDSITGNIASARAAGVAATTSWKDSHQ